MPEINGLPYTVYPNLSVDNLLVNDVPVVPFVPSGPNNSVQFNDSGSFSGSVDFSWDDTLKVLSINGSANASTFNGVALTTSGSTTEFLNASGVYSSIASQASGANTQVQFNDSGDFGSSPSLTFNGTTLDSPQFNGVALSSSGLATEFLNGNGAYSVPVPSPGGANSEVQFNNSGVLSGDSNFTWDGSVLGITGTVTVGGAVTASSFNGVSLMTGGLPTNFLNESGVYSSVIPTAPSGMDTQVQFNNAGAFGSSPSFTFDGVSLNASQFNGVPLMMGGASNIYLSGDGTYTSPAQASPSGSDTQVQFNDSGNFGASAALTFDGTTLNSTQFNGVALINSGASNQYLSADGSYSVPPVGAPSGSDTEIQFNNSGVFGSSPSLTFDGTTLNSTQFNGVVLTTAGTALDFLDATGSYVAGLDKATYDPTNVNADCFDKANEIGIEQVTGGILVPPAITADQDDYNPAGFDSNNLIRMTATGSFSITGMLAPAFGVNRIVTLHNTAANNLTIEDNDAGSLPANRFFNTNFAAVNILQDGTYRVWYDHISQRWRQY